MEICNFSVAWVGLCKNPNPCKEHKDTVCIVCGEQATRQCPETYQFVCGIPLCSKCKCPCKGIK